jgi:hypothetical protein
MVMYANQLPPEAIGIPNQSIDASIAMPAISRAEMIENYQNTMLEADYNANNKPIHRVAGSAQMAYGAGQVAGVFNKNLLPSHVTSKAVGSVASKVASNGAVGQTLAKGVGSLAGATVAPAFIGLDVYNANKSAKSNKKAMLAAYMPEIIQTFGKEPEQVKEDDLYALAKLYDKNGNPQLQHSLEKIDGSVGHKFAVSAATTVATTALLSPLGLFAIPAGIALAVTGIPDKVLGGIIGNISGHDRSETGHEALQRLGANAQANGGVAAADVIDVLKAGDKNLSEALDAYAHNVAGTAYDKIKSPAQKAYVVQSSMPQFLMATHQIAEEINQGVMQPTRILSLNTKELVAGGIMSLNAQTSQDIMREQALPATPTTSLQGGTIEREFMARAQGMGAQQAGLLAQSQAGNILEAQR